MKIFKLPGQAASRYFDNPPQATHPFKNPPARHASNQKIPGKRLARTHGCHTGCRSKYVEILHHHMMQLSGGV